MQIASQDFNYKFVGYKAKGMTRGMRICLTDFLLCFGNKWTMVTMQCCDKKEHVQVLFCHSKKLLFICFASPPAHTHIKTEANGGGVYYTVRFPLPLNSSSTLTHLLRIEVKFCFVLQGLNRHQKILGSPALHQTRHLCYLPHDWTVEIDGTYNTIHAYKFHSLENDLFISFSSLLIFYSKN